jgi:undecaprenyl-diphosphatase
MIKSRIRDVYHSTHAHRIGVVTWWYLLLSFMAVTVLVAGFVHLTDEVIEGGTLHLDQAVLLGIHQVHSPWLDALVASTTDIGGLIGVVILTLLAVGLLCLARKYRAVVQLLIGVGGAGLMNVLLKNMFERARPDLWQWLVHESSYSFPSGHAMASSALAMSVVLILWHTRWRWGAVAAAALYTVYVGLTRLYLGVHYPSDIIGAWIISAAWVVLASMVIGTIKPRIMKRR